MQISVGVPPELSAHQMAPAGAIAHSRAHLCPPFHFPPSSRHSGPQAWGFWVVATLGLLSFSTSLRTQVRLAIEIVSGKEGVRPRIAVIVSWYCSLRVQEFLEFAYWDTLEFASAPGLQGRWQWRSLRPLALPSSWCGLRLLYAIHQSLSLFGPCTAMVH